MCGRYFIDEKMAEEIEKRAEKKEAKERTRQKKVEERTGQKKLEEKNLQKEAEEWGRKRERDIYPTNIAPVIAADWSTRKDGLLIEQKQWGFPGFGNQRVIINARAETVLEKRMFSESVQERRVVIPAAGFYEWNKSKEKVTFTAFDQCVLYLAGFYKRFENGDSFVILTTAANETMRPIHDRMPLILEPEEIKRWLADSTEYGSLLRKVPKALNKNIQYEQQSLF